MITRIILAAAIIAALAAAIIAAMTITAWARCPEGAR